MPNEVVKREAAGVVFKGKDGELGANVEITVADVKKYLCPKASDAELYMFVQIARSQNLNPFAREIHFVPFKDRHSIVVGYETYIKRMEASGLCEGWKVEARNEGTEAEEYVFITWRKGWREPFEWPVKTNRFVKKYSGSPWETMPEHMKRKTAISQGIRMAYADAIGGLPYSHEETVAIGAEILDAEMEVDERKDTETGRVDGVFDGLKEVPAPDVPGDKSFENRADELADKLENIEPESPPECNVPWSKLKAIPAKQIKAEDVQGVIALLEYPIAGDDPAQVRYCLAKEYYKMALDKLEKWSKTQVVGTVETGSTVRSTAVTPDN